MGGTGSMVSAPSLSDGESHTLSGNVTADLILTETAPTIRGTISLPEGFTAPEDGLLFEVGLKEDYTDNTYATYYLPEGKSSFSYAICAPVQDEIQVYARLLSQDFRIYDQAINTFPESGLDQADLTFPESVTIRGTITVPEACRDGIALVNINSNALLEEGNYTSSSVNSSKKVAVPAGETQTSYTLRVPKGGTLTSLQVSLLADTQNLLSTSRLYLQPDLKSFATNSAALKAVLSEDLTLTTALSQGIFLSGTLSLADGLSAGKYTGTIQLQPVSIGRPANQYFEFTSTSYDYKFSLSPDAIGQAYYLSIRVDQGEGVLTHKTYYYVSNDVTTTDQSKATPITIGENGAAVNLTIPKAKIISGSLTAEDGSQVIWNPEENFRLYLNSSTGNESFNVTPDAEGNWSIAVDPGFSGEFTVYAQMYSISQTNVFGNREYYYSTTGQAVTEENGASPLTIGEGDVTDLKLYVETGWLLSGDINLPEGGYITGGTVTVSLSARSSSGSYYGRATVGPAGGSYFLAVPKERAEYRVTLNSVDSIPSEVSSNIYWGENQTLDTSSITGDTGGLDFTLAKAKAVITGTVHRPKNVTEFISMNIYALVELSPGYIHSYRTNLSLDSNKSSANFTIAIPKSVDVQEYQLHYNIYNNVSGVVTGEDIYLCSDGSLTTESNQAGTFSLANPPAHEFTLLTAKPFVSGKIYCPEGLTQSTSFVVYPQRADGISTYEFPQGAVEIMVGPGNGQQDEEGHWFSTYSLNDPSFPVGTSYRLVCYSIDTHTPADTSWYYVNQNGALTKDIDSATVYTIDGSADIVDFTPFLWGSGSESYVLQSEHGISSTADSVTYTYTCPGASSMNVTFSARTDVDLTLNNDFTPAAELAGKTVEISGDTLTVVMPALDFGGTSRFGFAVEKVEAVGGSSTPQTGAAAVYTSSGSSENAILSDVNAGEPVRVSFVSPADEYTTYLATGALYDKDGMLLDIVQVPVTFSDGTCTASLDFEQYGQAVTLKIFLLQDGLYRPEMAARAFTQKP